METQAVFAVYPGNKSYYVAENTNCVYGKSRFPIVPDTTFEECPHLNVIVVGEVPDAQLDNMKFIDFIKSRVKQAAYVTGISSGVIVLGKAGVLQGMQATAD